MSLYRVRVSIRAGDGHRGGAGVMVVEQLPLTTRLARAGLFLALGAGIGTLLLPVPLIRLFGVMFFLGMSFLAVRRLSGRTVVRSAKGRCPSCQAEEEYFVGTGWRRLAYPVSTTCPHCHVTLELEAAAVSGTS